MRRGCSVAELLTERLVLRPPVAADLAWQQQWLNTPAVRRNLGGAIDPEEFAAGFARTVAAFEAGEPSFFTVTLRITGEPVGKCGLSLIETSRAPPILAGQVQAGWTLAERFWGKGYATEAARAVISHAFRERDLPVLWAQTSDSNAGSSRVMARLGFSRRADLDYVDPDYPPQDNPTAVYRLARKEWSE